MQTLVKPIMSQIKYQIETIKPLIHKVDYFDMAQEIYPGGRTARELLNHIALIPEADFKLSQGASYEEILAYYNYWEKEMTSTEMIEARLDLSFNILEDMYRELEQEDLERITTSYYDTSYSQIEWLLEILTHLSHHRAQLFSFLKTEGKPMCDIQLFE